jgi:hypothetical protein
MVGACDGISGAANAGVAGTAGATNSASSDVANEGVDLEVKKGDLLRVRLHYSGVARHSDVHQI